MHGIGDLELAHSGKMDESFRSVMVLHEDHSTSQNGF